MYIEDYFPSHAKRAEWFRIDANSRVLATVGIWDATVYNFAEARGRGLIRSAKLANNQPIKKARILQQIDTLDHQTVDFTAIAVEAKSQDSEILYGLLSYLDELARLYSSVLPDPEPRVFEFQGKHKDLPWLLNTVWYWVDKSR